jgi:predicted metal-dependent hydrolase
VTRGEALARLDDIREGARLFADGHFWHAHEAWERVWIVEKNGPRGRFVQGLIQIAAAMHKLLVMNDSASAARLLARAREKIEPYPDAYEGFAVDTLRADLDACANAVPHAPFDRARIPRIIV